MVLTVTSTPIDQIKQIKFLWHERVSQYEFYSCNSKYISYIIFIRKASGASASNIFCQDSDMIIFDLSLHWVNARSHRSICSHAEINFDMSLTV